MKIIVSSSKRRKLWKILPKPRNVSTSNSEWKWNSLDEVRLLQKKEILFIQKVSRTRIAVFYTELEFIRPCSPALRIFLRGEHHFPNYKTWSMCQNSKANPSWKEDHKKEKKSDNKLKNEVSLSPPLVANSIVSFSSRLALSLLLLARDELKFL